MASSANDSVLVASVASLVPVAPVLRPTLSTLLASTPEQQARANMALCREIIECQTIIGNTRKRLTALKQQHRQQVQLQALRNNAVLAWPVLSRKRKWNKQVLQAALQSPCLPDALEEGAWEHFVPAHVRHDADLFVLRLNRPQFCHYYRCTSHPFYFPDALRSNLHVVCQVVRVYPEIVHQSVLTEEQLDSVAVFQALLQSFGGGVTVAAVLHFSDRLRADEALMLSAVQASHYTCLASLNPTLRNNIEFALAVAALANQPDSTNTGTGTGTNETDAHQHHQQRPKQPFPATALKCFSARCKADKQVCQAFCKAAGGNLEFCSYPIRRDYATVTAAVQNDPTALQYCLQSRTRKRLGSDKEFMLAVFTRVTAANRQRSAVLDLCQDSHTQKRRNRNNRRLYKFLNAHLKANRQVLVAALAAQCANTSDISKQYLLDPTFWHDVLKQNSVWYTEMPETLQTVRRLAVTAVCNIISMADGKAVVDRVATHFPFALDHAALLQIARVFSYDYWDVFWPWAEQMWSHAEIVLQACLLDGDALECVDSPFSTNRDILMAALTQTPDALCFVPVHVQHMHPDVVAAAIRNTPSQDLWELYDSICEELWENRGIVLAWVRAGGDYLLDHFDEEMEDDQELFLLIAAKNWEDFCCASHDLQNNKEFMLQAVEKEGKLLREASAELAEDFDLALVAFSSSSDVVSLYLTERDEDFLFLVKFALGVRERLEVHTGFVQGVLCGTTRDIKPLSVLNQGRETTYAYTKLIADFLGIPKGQELRRLRHASSHLAAWGF